MLPSSLNQLGYVCFHLARRFHVVARLLDGIGVDGNQSEPLPGSAVVALNLLDELFSAAISQDLLASTGTAGGPLL